MLLNLESIGRFANAMLLKISNKKMHQHLHQQYCKIINISLVLDVEFS